MPTRIQLRRGTSAQWSAADPILAAGEPGYDTTTGDLKVGDGVKKWSQLPSYVDNVELPQLVADALNNTGGPANTAMNNAISAQGSSYGTALVAVMTYGG